MLSNVGANSRRLDARVVQKDIADHIYEQQYIMCVAGMRCRHTCTAHGDSRRRFRFIKKSSAHVMPPPASRLFLTACCRPMLVVFGRCECVCVLAPVFWSAVLCIWRFALSSLAFGLELERSHVEAALHTPGLALSLEARPNSRPCRRIEPCATILDPLRHIVSFNCAFFR